MKTVPLHGKKAAGRVALVDDEDYDLVMRYRWNVWEPAPKPGCRQEGPYAITNAVIDGRQRSGVRMHKLITGWPQTDHKDHDGLNNQRSNLRQATDTLNRQNSRPNPSGTQSSQYKGVCWLRNDSKWRAYISVDGHRQNLGDFLSELEAAYIYDEAARRFFGEFACTNFAEEPAREMRDEWEAERAAHAAVMEAEQARRSSEMATAMWAERQPEARICVLCSAPYQSRSTTSLYCGKKCRKKANLPAEAARKRVKRAREREERKMQAES